MTRVFVAVYLIEAGLILAWSPWTAWWRRNYFADVVPQLGMLMGTQGMRAAVVTVGVLTVVVGAAVVAEGRRRAVQPAAGTGSQAPLGWEEK